MTLDESEAKFIKSLLKDSSDTELYVTVRKFRSRRDLYFSLHELSGKDMKRIQKHYTILNLLGNDYDYGNIEFHVIRKK